MPLYHRTLPREIPAELFENLDGNVHDGIRRKLRAAYSGVARDTYTVDSNPLAALSNLFVGTLGETVSAKSLIKMFRPVVGKYVVEEQRQPSQQQRQEEQSQPEAVQNLEQRAESVQGQLALF